MTFEEALCLIPTHVMLRPGIDKWQEGDEYYSYRYSLGKQTWNPMLRKEVYGSYVTDETLFRRPIPESVRQGMAENLLSVRHQGQKRNDSFETWLLATQGVTNAN